MRFVDGEQGDPGLLKQARKRPVNSRSGAT
jgi:hypothetical protein